MNEVSHNTAGSPRWVHALAILTALATVPLLLLGAEVTTKQVGMVDQQGFRTPWHLFTVPAWEESLGFGIGFIIEHGHRLFGFIVGLCSIGLALALWRTDRRSWVRWLGVLCLTGVCLQGLLGAFRVQINALLGPELALVHGLFAQIVFGLLVTAVFVTSRSWSRETTLPTEAVSTRHLRLWCLLAAGILYFQLILGAIVRRTEIRQGPRLHLLFAFVAAGVLVLLVRAMLVQPRGRRLLKTLGVTLAVLLGTQLILGLEAWLTKFATVSRMAYADVRPLLGAPEATPPPGHGWEGLFRAMFAHPDFMRSLHFLVGALLFAVLVSATFYVFRAMQGVQVDSALTARNLEEAA